MKNKNFHMLISFIIGLLFVSAIIGLLVKSVLLGIKIIAVVILIAFGIKAIIAIKALLETFFNKKH